MLKLSAVIITYNEEKNIRRCLESLASVADEIVVLDSFSTDNTEAICKEFNTVFVQQEFVGHIEQKNAALKIASNDYIISLDGDESLSEELQESILILKDNWEKDGYICKRKNFFRGQWINYSHWYPNKKLRVFDRRKCHWGGLNPHDHIVMDVDAEVGTLEGDILHWTFQSISDFNKKIEYFSSISARAYFNAGIKSNYWKIFANPFWAFTKSYLLKLGFLDGFNGMVICMQTAHQTYLKYIKLMEIQKNSKP